MRSEAFQQVWVSSRVKASWLTTPRALEIALAVGFLASRQSPTTITRKARYTCREKTELRVGKDRVTTWYSTRMAAGYTSMSISIEATGGPVNNRFCAIEFCSLFSLRAIHKTSVGYIMLREIVGGKFVQKKLPGTLDVIRNSKDII